MALDVAHPEAINTSLSPDVPMTNGAHDPIVSGQKNAGAFDENATVSKADYHQNSSGPTPIEDVAPGIAPVADFNPKDAPTSHPTPPPDEPLVNSDANVDTDMSTAVDGDQDMADSAPESGAPVNLTTGESSLVRPREEDEDDDNERAAKRNKMEPQSIVNASIDALPSADAHVAMPSEHSAEPAPEVTATPPVPDLVSEPVLSPGAQQPSQANVSNISDVVVKAQPQSDMPEATADAKVSSVEKAAEPVLDGENVQPAPELPAIASPAPVQSAAATSDAQPATPQSASLPARPQLAYSTAPMTPAQLRFLQEKTKNLKKTKNSSAFLHPVDPVALNIPTYPEIVKTPMDLGTMEAKLKSGQHASVQDYATDFYLIVDNARQFNGENHPVTQSGLAMEAYFRKMMESVPTANQPAPKPQAKKSSPKPPVQAPRREPRQAVTTTTTTAQVAAPSPVAAQAPIAPPPPTAAAAAASSSEAFALQPDGTPQIRRDSTINRPPRAIKPPPPRELAYSKPKRKEHQLELKFCQHVLNELRGTKYASINHVFLTPVDPVALNIPHYRQIVKHPMDMSTIAQKLKQGQYGKASEFKRDFDLMISNCLAFNPAGNPVRALGLSMQHEFDALWKSKEKWERGRKADAQLTATASADEESGGEEEEEEDGPDDEKAETIRALQKQLAEIQNALAGMNQAPAKKKKAPKPAAKPPGKKTASVGAAPKQKPLNKAKPTKKARQVTYEEKQEISEAVGRMNSEQVEQLTNIITTNCKKYANQEEMELEIDDLPNDVQAMLLKYVRSIFGNPNKGARAASPEDVGAFDDDDFEPEHGGRKASGAAKRKKHKPMGKKEQQDAINNIQKQLAQFQGGTTNGSQSPPGYPARDDTSGDDESEESEEE